MRGTGSQVGRAAKDHLTVAPGQETGRGLRLRTLATTTVRRGDRRPRVVSPRGPDPARASHPVSHRVYRKGGHTNGEVERASRNGIICPGVWPVGRKRKGTGREGRNVQFNVHYHRDFKLL